MRMKDNLEAGALQQEEKHLNHVLLIYRRMIPSIRLCGHCQMEFLAQAGKLEYRAVQEMKLKSSDLNWADIVLLGRLDSWYECQLTTMLHKAGKTLAYILDDDLLNILPELSSAPYYGQKQIRGYIRRMLELSDAVISPSPLLLEKYAVDGREAVQIEEPAIDPISYTPHDPDKPVKIGFAGSIDRTGDIEELLKDALLRIRREYQKKVRFEFFGVIPSFAGELEAKCIPYCDSYDEYRRVLNSLEWDIGLAPMPDTPFHACKHYNKFVEYAAADVVGIFSAVMPYTRLKGKERDAVLCGNTSEEWYGSIKRLLDNPAEREAMREALSRRISAAYSVQSTAEEFLKRLPKGNGGADGGRISGCRLVLCKGANLWLRAVDLVRRYGWKLPKKLLSELKTRIQ